MDERHEIDLAEWLRSVGEAASAARFIREFGLVGSSDPAIVAVVKTRCTLRDGEDGALLAAVCGAPDLTKEGRRAWRRVDRAIEELQRRREMARARGLRVPPSFWDCEEGCAGHERALQLEADAAGAAIEGESAYDTVSDSQGVPASGSPTHGGLTKEETRMGASAAVVDGDVPDEVLPAGQPVEDEGEKATEGSEGAEREEGPGSKKATKKMRLVLEMPPHGSCEFPMGRFVLRPVGSPDVIYLKDGGEGKKRREAGATKPATVTQETYEQVPPPCLPGVAIGGVNPFLQVPVRSSDLEWKEVMKVYRAMAFALDQGVVMSAHVVIVWSMFGVTDHERASKLTGKVLHEARKWAAVGKPTKLRQRQRARSGDGFDLAWVYAHENDRRRGFHTHILMNVPTALAGAFERWLWSALRRLTNNPGVPPALWVRPAWEQTEPDQIQRHWRWMTYIMKGLPPSVGMRYRGEASLGPAREVMQLVAYREDTLPVFCDRLVNVSRNIDKKAQKAAGFVSKLQKGPAMLDRLYDGSEWRAGEIREKFNAVAPTLHF